jgi:hypothetical protein
MDLPLARFGGRAFRAPMEKRRRFLRAVGSWGLVALVHLAFFFLLLFSQRQPPPLRVAERETILLFLPLRHAAPPPRPPMTRSKGERPVPRVTTAPITLPPMVLVPARPSDRDILGAIGRELACGAGSFEYLPEDLRAACSYSPWLGMRMPDGTIVIASPAPPPTGPLDLNDMSGADYVRHEMDTAPACPPLQNTPCLNNSIIPLASAP